MKLPRDASGRQVIAALEQSFGYRAVHREGSHVVLQTDSPGVIGSRCRTTRR